MASMNGKQLLELGQQMFNTHEALTLEQYDYILSMLDPVNYLLKNHKVKGHPMTFSIPDRDFTKLASHRPWQMEMVRDTVDPNQKSMAVIKSRQLGLTYSSLAG